MKRLSFFAPVAVLALSVSLAGFANGQSGLSIQIQLAASQVILGEPLFCNITWENRSDLPVTIAYTMDFLSPLIKPRLQGSLNEKCAAPKDFVEWQSGARTVIQPKETVTRQFSPMDFGAVNAGDYELWIEYDATKLEPFWDKYGVARIRAESNHVRFSIVSPLGDDAKIFSRHANQCNGITLTSQELLRRYPASTYAVYALAQFYGLTGFSPPLETERERAYLQRLLKIGKDDLADRTRHFATGPDGKDLKDAQGKPVTITQEEWLLKRIEEAEQICAAHPELPMSEQIRYNVIGSYYVDLLQFQNAAKVFEKLRDSAVDPQIRGNSGKMIQLLNEAGLVAN